MASLSGMHKDRTHHLWQWDRLVQQILLVPEAITLLGLLLLAWALNFPPLLGMLAIIVACLFVVRMGLITLTEHQLARGFYARADRFAQAALRLNPWSTDAILLRAQGLTQRGEDEAAERILRQATQRFPRNYTLQRALAATILAQGRIAEGSRMAAFDPQREPQSPQVAQQRAWLALHIEENAAKARMLIVDAHPDTYPPRVGLPLLATLAEAQITLNLLMEAQHTLSTIEKQLSACPQPQQAELLYHLGRLHGMLGHDGTLYFRRSVECDPAGRYAQAAWRSAVDSAA